MRLRGLRAAWFCMALASTGLARAEVAGNAAFADGAAVAAETVAAIASGPNSPDAPPTLALAALALLALAGGRRRQSRA